MYYLHVEYLLPPMVGNNYISDVAYSSLPAAMKAFDEHVRLASLNPIPAITYVDIVNHDCRLIASWKSGVNN